jgi:HSP20 family protein
MNGFLTTRDLFPRIRIPSLLEDFEESLSSGNLINGLSLSRDDKNVYVEAAVPGIDPKAVDVTFENGVLTIRAEKKEEEKEKKYYRKATSSFYYQVVPEDVDLTAEPVATCKNGMMKVTIPIAAKATAKKIPVKEE